MTIIVTLKDSKIVNSNAAGLFLTFTFSKFLLGALHCLIPVRYQALCV